MSFDGERMWRSLEEVNAFGATPSGGAERLAWTGEEIAARAWLVDRCRELGLDPEHDEAGNVWALGPRRPSVVMGSHLDTVPDGGRFDGALGVVAALEAVRSARADSSEGADRLGLACFTDEEGVRFGLGMMGSRAVAGRISVDELRASVATDGQRLWDVLVEAGHPPEGVTGASRRRARLAAYLELHVEQGRRLERAQAPVGIVTAIAGLSHWSVEVKGASNHAGTTQPEDRRDALVPVAALALEAQRLMRARSGLVATVGEARVEGGATNIVPGRARCSLDVRSASDETIDEALGALMRALRASAEDNGCTLEVRETKRLHPASMASEVVAALRRAAREQGLEAPEVESMAGHDAMNLAAAGVPCGMLFVRSEGGVSHSPRERSERSDCVLGATILRRAALLVVGSPK